MAEMTVASTTDTQKDIDAAAGVIEEQPEVKVESNEVEEPEAKEEPKAEEKHSKSHLQKKIDRLYYFAKENERQAKAREKENEELRARLAQYESKVVPAAKEVPAEKEEAPAANARPKQEDFNDYDEYVEALADWKTEQKLAKKLEEFQQQEAKEAAEKQAKDVFDAYQKRCDDAREKYEDFDDVAWSDVEAPNVVLDVIRQHENGPDLQYYLGSHKDFSRKLLAMSPAMALVEVGKLMDKFAAEAEGEPEPQATRKSNAPPPIKPIGGSATKSSIAADELPYQEYRRLREQQIKAKYRR